MHSAICMKTMKSFRGLIGVMSLISFAMVGAIGAAAPPRIGDQGFVVQGTIVWASANGEQLRLKDGTRLTVPQGVNVPRAQLTAPHSVKAFYTPTDRGNVVTLIEVQELHP